MSKLTTFLVSDLTKDRYAMAIAGICLFDFTEDMREEIRGLISSYTFDMTDDVYEIDYCMAQYFCQKAPEYILGWGITIDIPGLSGPTGGIIGNPHRDIDSADSTSEDIGMGLSVAAHPGGPGIIILGDVSTARKILSLSKPSEGGKAPLLAMAKKALDFNIRTAIMITDGTGFNASGCALTMEGNSIKYISLDGSVPDEH